MAHSTPAAQFFISYAREDKTFALGLRRALKARGRLAFVDVHNIAALADWQREIAAAIDAADVFVFVISPESVDSDACREELALAVAARKQLAPVLLRASKAVPAALERPNWLFADKMRSREALAERLIKAADVDPDWLRQHTWLLLRARVWSNDRATDHLLSGQSLQDALSWLTHSRQRSKRAVSKLHAEYIEASRAAAAAAAAEQRQLLQRAVARQLAAQSYIAQTAPEDGLETAVLLAIDSLRNWPTVEGDRALRQAIERLPRPPLLRVEHREQLGKIIAEGTTLLVSRQRGIRAISLESGKPLWNVRSPPREGLPSTCACDALVFQQLKGGSMELREARSGALRERVRRRVDTEPHRPEAKPAADGSAVLLTSSEGYRRYRVEVWPWRNATGKAPAPVFTTELAAMPRYATLPFDGSVLVVITTTPRPSGAYTDVTFYDTSTGAKATPWRVSGLCAGATVSSDGRWLALVADQRSVHVCRLDGYFAGWDEKKTLTMLPHDAAVTSVRASGTEYLLCLTDEGETAHLWRPLTGQLVRRYRCGGRAQSVRLCPDQASLAVELPSQGLSKPEVRVIDGKHPTRVALLDHESAMRVAVEVNDRPSGYAVNGRGQLVICEHDATTVWDADTGSYLRRVATKFSPQLCFSADSAHFLARAPNGGVTIGAIAEQGQHLVQGGQSIWCAAFVDGTSSLVATVGNPPIAPRDPTYDSNIRLWDVAGPHVLREHPRETSAAVAFSPGGRRVAVFVPSAGHVKVLDVTDGRSLCSLPATDVAELLFDADGAHLAGRNKAERVVVWRLVDAAIVANFAASWIRGIDLRSGLALSGNAVLDMALDKPILDNIKGPSIDFVHGLVAFVVDRHIVEVRGISKRGHERPVRFHHQYAIGAAFSPDGLHLVTYGADHDARVWELSGSTEVARFQHQYRVLDASFSPNGRIVATWGAPTRDSCEVTFWTYLREDLIAEARRRVTRSLTRLELDRYLPDHATRLP